MLRRLLISALFLLPLAAQGGGEVPFPLDGQNQLTVLQENTLLNHELALLVQVRIYQSTDGGREAKVWIRAADGFVWDRAWTRVGDDAFTIDVELDGQKGAMIIDVKRGGQLFLGDAMYLFKPQP